MAATLRTLRSRWLSVLAGLIAGGLVAGVVLFLSVPSYQVQTRFFISATNASDLSSAVQGSLLAQNRVQSYAEYLTDQQLTSAVIGDLGLDMTPQELGQEISATVVPDTTILSVTVTDPSAQRAFDIASSIDRQFQRLVAQLETPEGQTQSPVKVTVTAAPELPTAPSSPDIPLIAGAGIVLGLLAGAGLALLRDRLDSRVRDSETASALAGAPFLGLFPHDPDMAKRTSPATPSPRSTTAEALHRLRANLDFLDVDNPPRVIAVSSATEGEGKTTLAVNLAHALARSGRSVLLIDADLRRPHVAATLGLVEGPGLTNVLNGSADLDTLIQTVADGDLSVLGAGPTPPEPGLVLGSGQTRALIEKLRSSYDVVIVDTAPILPVADTSELATIVDGVLLCVRYRGARQREVLLAREILDRVGARVLGVSLTMADGRIAAEHGYGRRYE